MIKVNFTLEELNIISDLLTNRISQSPSNISELLELDLKITNAATEQMDAAIFNSQKLNYE